MLDFMLVSTRSVKKGLVEIFPKFIVKSSNDLMIRGGDFYAVWNEETKLWATEEEVALYLIDKELDTYAKEHTFGEDSVKVLHMWDSDSGSIDRWHKYVQKQMRDHYVQLDDRIIFSNDEPKKKDYASKRLQYPIGPGSIEAYDELIGTLYSPEERKKIEWAIGAIVSGESVTLQKFIVMYGSAGTGKSTILNIIQSLFEGYYSVFDAKAIGSSNNAFALEPFKNNPLVAIQHDGDLSRIEDNTRLNSVVSHELMTVNEKFKAAYSNRFRAFLFMGTNRPVKITDAKSGILRRLIDVSPSGDKVTPSRYKELMNQIEFELGAIAYHCKEVYLANRHAYDDYVPLRMMGASNDFYNFVLDSYDDFILAKDGISLSDAYSLYDKYADKCNIVKKMPRRQFGEELKNYFEIFEERSPDGSRTRSWYTGFKFDKFRTNIVKIDNKPPKKGWLIFDSTVSAFDKLCADFPAQYATINETPQKKWSNCSDILHTIDTSKLHYVKVPVNHIVIDFDIPGADGKKSLDANLAAASKWPKTYAELSKSGQGIHLHYIYEGRDPTQLSRIYDDHIEIKVFNGDSSLRRRLSKCNSLDISSISTGLPLKEEKKTPVPIQSIKDASKLKSSLQERITKCLNKEYEPHSTASMVSLIKTILDDAYASGVTYDMSAYSKAVYAFAGSSTNQKEQCRKLCHEMHFTSADIVTEEEHEEDLVVTKALETAPMCFFDIEVFPNLFIVCYKLRGPEHHVVSIINPSPLELVIFNSYRMIGYNNRTYDNHIMWGRMTGENNLECYHRSKRIIDKHDRSAFFPRAYGWSYTDVLDFVSKKQSLKKYEIELGKTHMELGLDWNKPVPEELWNKVAEYCGNDVEATEAVFEARYADFVAREILANLTGLTVNDPSNSHSARLIFGKNKTPQGEFLYRDLSKPVAKLPDNALEFLHKNFPDMMSETHGEAHSLLPYFPGYSYSNGQSSYRGVTFGEGGFVYAVPGMYQRVITFDVASMHPHSITSEYLFGEYTEIFNQLLETRILIKHKEFEKAAKLFDGKLERYLQNKDDAKALSSALKIVINSVYGLTAQKESEGYCSPFRDKRNVDNIVAKRGELFMIDLMNEVIERGGRVIHIKTDSIKVVDPSPELVEFILSFGKRYGYDFEVEHIFEKFCLVNKSVYVAKLAADDPEAPGEWTATGTQFQVPYVFKTLFSHEPVIFEDFCETKSVTDGAIYLDFDEKNREDIMETLKDSKAPGDWRTSPKFYDWIEKRHPEIWYANKNIVHDYKFVGRVGQFTPVLERHNGGVMYRIKDDKASAITGTKGYRWVESDILRVENSLESIDKSYYKKMVDQAVEALSEFGDFEWFVS